MKRGVKNWLREFTFIDKKMWITKSWAQRSEKHKPWRLDEWKCCSMKTKSSKNSANSCRVSWKILSLKAEKVNWKISSANGITKVQFINHQTILICTNTGANYLADDSSVFKRQRVMRNSPSLNYAGERASELLIYPAILRHRLWNVDSYTKPGLQLAWILIIVLISGLDSRSFMIRSVSAILTACAVVFLAKITFNDPLFVIRMLMTKQKNTFFSFILFIALLLTIKH